MYWTFTSAVVIAILLSVCRFIVVVNATTEDNWIGISNELTLDTPPTDQASHCVTGKTRSVIQDDCYGWNKHNFTVVTALFDIGRDSWPYFRRNYEDYLNYGQQLLSLDVNMVIFIEPKGKMFVEENRRGKQSKTVIRVMEKHDLLYAKLYLKKTEAIMSSPEFKTNHELLKHPEGFSPWYNIVTNSKVNLITEAFLVDKFNSSFYSWIDFGYGHGNEIYPASRVWSPQNIMTSFAADKITYIQLHDREPKHIDDVFKKRALPFLIGGFFAGSKKALVAFNDLFHKVFQEFLQKGIVDDDQTLSLACYLQNPRLFNLVRGDWYDLFKLFH